MEFSEVGAIRTDFNGEIRGNELLAPLFETSLPRPLGATPRYGAQKTMYNTGAIHGAAQRKFGRFLMGLVRWGRRDFPLFSTHFSLFLRNSPLFLRIFPLFLRIFPPFTTHGEFHSDPVCTDPVQNFPKNERGAPPQSGEKNNMLPSFDA